MKMSQLRNTTSLFGDGSMPHFAEPSSVKSLEKENMFNATTTVSEQPVVGELVFGKFIKIEEEEENHIDPFNFNLNGNTQAATSQVASETPSTGFIGEELDSAVVDAFFSSSTDSTPMFEFESITDSNNSNPKEWSSLFDNDIPIITEEDVMKNDKAIESTEELVSKSIQTTNINTSFLPTPIIDDIKITSNQSHSPSMSSPAIGRISKKSSISIKDEKVDKLGVVAYNRKQRTLPLTPVIPESDDPVAVKRARNTEAARRSRARKLQRMNQLEDRVKELLDKNNSLEQEVARLRKLLGGN